MIETKQDVRKIHQLRIIGIFEAGFNTALKIIFAKKLIYQAEQYVAICIMSNGDLDPTGHQLMQLYVR